MSLVGAASLVRHGEDGDPIFEPVSFELVAGQRLALRGPSGSGKTLLLRALTMLEDADSGAVTVAGEPIADADIPGFRRRVHLLAQSSPMIVGDVRDNLALAFNLGGEPAHRFDEERARSLLARFELDSLYRRSSGDLSGGERQVVALVRALLVDPDVLLLDEPTSAMDPARTEVAEALVDEWHAEGDRASVWVSHDAAQLARVTTSSLLMVRVARGPG